MSSQMPIFDEEKKEAATIKLEVDREHAEILIHSPNEKVNKLTRAAFLELRDCFGVLRAKADQIKTLIIRSTKPDMFLAGADIREIVSMTEKAQAMELVERAQEVFQELAELPQWTIAAIDGPCMGGGLELALACKTRIASDNPSTKLGLPEVMLGVLPGAGGTQRLPKTVNLLTALEMMTTGAALDFKKALKVGLVSDVVPKEYLLAHCRKLARGEITPRRSVEPSFVDMVMTWKPVRNFIFSKAHKKIIEKTKGFYPAPLRIVDVVKKTYGLPIVEGLKIEADGFSDLAISPEAKNLMHLFFATEELKKDRGVAAHEIPQFKPTKYFQCGVVGAGVMGGGIASVAAARSISVRMKDISHEALLNGLKTAHGIFDKDLKRRKISKSDYHKRVYAVQPTLDFSGFSQMPFVIEAIIERLDLKIKLIEELERELSPTAIIASNTSSLSIGDMAKEAKHPERIVGMHFFNPVPKMPLVEVIRTDKTSPEVVAQTVAFGKQLGKTVIVVKDRPGFLVNRILMPFLIESVHLYDEGYSIDQIDSAALRFGMPMGPFHLLDVIGLDTAAKVARVIATAFPHMVVLPMIDDMVAQGLLGQKKGRGFYHYNSRGDKLALNTEFQKDSRDEGEPTEALLQDRLILPMVTEAVMALEEGVISSARDCDIGLIYGIGFPPFRGGLLKWVSGVGEQKILDRMHRLHQLTKGRLIVPPAFETRARNGQSFYRNEL